MYGNCGPMWGGRRFLTKEEKTSQLKDYQESLENELKAVKERLKEISKE